MTGGAGLFSHRRISPQSAKFKLPTEGRNSPVPTIPLGTFHTQQEAIDGWSGRILLGEELVALVQRFPSDLGPEDQLPSIVRNLDLAVQSRLQAFRNIAPYHQTCRRPLSWPNVVLAVRDATCLGSTATADCKRVMRHCPIYPFGLPSAETASLSHSSATRSQAFVRGLIAFAACWRQSSACWRNLAASRSDMKMKEDAD
jgi:hypothetical protein